MIGLAARSYAADQPTRGDLAGDMAILRQALTLHPGLYRYNSPAEIDGRLSGLADAFVRSGSLEVRYLLLSRFLASLRCGHSYCNFFNQRAPIATALFDRPTCLPLQFRWLGNAMVVTRDPSGRLQRGSQIVAVNGRSAQELQDLLLPYVRADGHNDGKRRALIERRGDTAIETFDVFQGLLAPPAGGVHRLTVLGSDQRRRSFLLPAARPGPAQPAIAATPSAPLWQMQASADGVACLTMSNWGLWDSKWDWRSWLQDALDGVSDARALIVDLRDNEGGDEACGNALLGRFVAQRFEPPAIEQRLRFRTTPPALDPYLDTWDAGFRTLGEGAVALSDGFYLRPNVPARRAIEPVGKQLALPMVVLTSPVNSSATFQFVQNVRALGVARLIGATTGGNRRGINGGCFFFVRLPASGIEFDLPLVGYFPATAQPDAGIVPDEQIILTAADIAMERDVAMARARAWIARGRA
ncbi:S41 family peptidase [Sphingomonas sp.]|uniref:S41 family peptidase n=1 Tax=Sphingomonas sp. TaxID=28214 RepID=UPI0028AAB5A9|nr:S41 family peptidase [Sphingomonas sp.]